METTDASTIVQRLLDPAGPGAIRVGPAQAAGTLTLVPLFHEARALPYLLFAHAAGMDLVQVAEVDEAGSVPELLVTNSATRPVLLIEGEVLVGLKQNRTLTTTILVPAGTTTLVPVACVEQGRWNRRSAFVRSDDYLLSPRVRQLTSESVVRGVRASGSYRADQGAVWRGVEEELDGHAIDSPTHAYSDVNLRRDAEIRALLAGIRPMPGQTGVVAVVDGRPRCADLVDRSTTFRRLWRRIVGSYAADALRPDALDTSPVTTGDVAAWLHALTVAEATVHPAVGLGSTVALTLADCTATALVAGGRVVHLTAFAAPARGGQAELPR
jgi:hypothetical protein